MEPPRFERLPPETVISPLLNDVPGLRLKAKVTREFSPEISEVSLVFTATVLAMPVRLVPVKLRKKIAFSLVLRERMSPKPILSNLLTLV